MPFNTPDNPSDGNINPNTTNKTAPLTAHTASGSLKGRMITPAIDKSEMIQMIVCDISDAMQM